jgi:hypothetical protein
VGSSAVGDGTCDLGMRDGADGSGVRDGGDGPGTRSGVDGIGARDALGKPGAEDRVDGVGASGMADSGAGDVTPEGSTIASSPTLTASPPAAIVEVEAARLLRPKRPQSDVARTRY